MIEAALIMFLFLLNSVDGRIHRFQWNGEEFSVRLERYILGYELPYRGDFRSDWVCCL